MKKIYYFMLFITFIFIYQIWYWAWLTQEDLLTGWSTIWVTWNWLGSVDQVFVYWKSLFFTLISIITIATFMYLWYVIITSKWNEEEYKTALKWFVYAVIWLAVIPLSWWLIKIITSLDF